jgi:hypothetical protein
MLTNIKSALVSGVIMAILAIAGYVLGVGDVYSLDHKMIVNTGVMALLTAIVSYIKSSATDDAGKFLGITVK